MATHRRRSDIINQPYAFQRNYNKIAKGENIKARMCTKLVNTEPDNYSYDHIYNGIKIPMFQDEDDSHLKHSNTLLFANYALQDKYIFHYPSKFIFPFELLMNVLIIYSICESLNDLSFKITFAGKEIISELVWALFVIDFMTSFIWIKRKTYANINKKSDVSLKYLKTWAIIDLISIIPLRFTNNPNLESSLKCLRVFKVTRLTQMLDIKKVTRICIQKFTQNEKRFLRLELFIQMVWNLILVVVYMMLLTYALACIWWYVSLTVDKYRLDSQNFVHAYEFDGLSTAEKLLRTMYFILTSLLTVGYGDYSATNKYEMALCIFLVTFGAVFFAYNMALAGSYIGEISKLLQNNENLVKLKKLLGKLEGIKGPLPNTLQNSIYSHFNFFWENDRLGCLAKENKESNSIKELIKRHHRYFKPLPTCLKKRIFDSLFNDYFRHFRILFPIKNDFRYHICTFIKPRKISQGTVIISEGSMSEEILMVSQGQVSLNFYDLGESLTTCKTFTGWYILGDYSVVLNKPSYATFRAETEVVALCISKRPFQMILIHYFPEYLEELKDIIKRRNAKLLSLMNQYGFDMYRETLQEMYAEKRKKAARNTVAIKDLTIIELYLKFKENYQKLSK